MFTNYDKVLDELEGKAPKDSEDTTDASKDRRSPRRSRSAAPAAMRATAAPPRVNNRSNIETGKDYSHGIMAQSIGGGGGNATLNIAVVYEGKSDKNKGFNLAVGGAPGNGGDGSTVDGDQRGHGRDVRQGILRRAGAVDRRWRRQRRPRRGLLEDQRRQGRDHDRPRTAAPADSGGDVSLTSNGTVTTHGGSSYGLLAQSVGNGGGNSSSTSVSVTVPEEGDTPERAASVSVGLEGGLGGRAGNVALNASGAVITNGEDSHAIFAQSVGGGGGNGGSATGAAITSSTAAVAIGGTGGQGGTGGTVDVDQLGAGAHQRQPFGRHPRAVGRRRGRHRRRWSRRAVFRARAAAPSISRRRHRAARA